METVKIITMNIGNPSLHRVHKQIEWLIKREEDIFVLTETKNSDGCKYLEKYFTELGTNLIRHGEEKKFYVFFPKVQTGDLGTMILSKFPICDVRQCFEYANPFFQRMINVVIDIKGIKLGVVGIYVPSRNSSPEKIARKKRFVIESLRYIKKLGQESSTPYIICGDFNVLERNHVPRYSNFQSWEYDFYERFSCFGYEDAFRHLHPTQKEYSWVGRTNNGYRYDHMFVSRELLPNIESCKYIHQTREIHITDHSAMTLSLRL